MRTLLAPSLFALMLVSACGENAGVNPPTEPAQAIETPEAPGRSVTPSSSTAPMLPGAGPTSFVGRWTADVSWCANPVGDHRPIEITPVRFEGYENSCHIYAIDETENGYAASLQCQSEGAAHNERVHMSVSGQVLTLDYLDRPGPAVRLLKCTTLTDTSTRAPALPVPGKSGG